MARTAPVLSVWDPLNGIVGLALSRRSKPKAKCHGGEGSAFVLVRVGARQWLAPLVWLGALEGLGLCHICYMTQDSVLWRIRVKYWIGEDWCVPFGFAVWLYCVA